MTKDELALNMVRDLTDRELAAGLRELAERSENEGTRPFLVSAAERLEAGEEDVTREWHGETT